MEKGITKPSILVVADDFTEPTTRGKPGAGGAYS